MSKIVNGARRYCVWAGRPQGVAENPTRCIEEIFPKGRGEQHRQCDRKRGMGEDGLYCALHAIDHPSAADRAKPPVYVYGVDTNAKNVPTLQRAVVLEDGKKMVTLDEAGSAFGYRTRIEREKVARTPDEAWTRYCDGLAASIRAHERSAAEARRLLASAQMIMAPGRSRRDVRDGE